ncbi:MAG: GFA family protein [Oceanospirillaceae bacterium]|nr:GFA family protein [Oceanospirillaceae bacterium]
MTDIIHGHCLCGAVTFEIQGPFKRFILCHCSRCQRASGSAHVSNLFCKPDQLKWLGGEDQVRRFDLTGADRFGKSFCTNCGSPLPHVGKDGSYLLVPAGSLDDDPGLRPQAHIFCANRAVWDDDSLERAPHFDQYPE